MLEFRSSLTIAVAMSSWPQESIADTIHQTTAPENAKRRAIATELTTFEWESSGDESSSWVNKTEKRSRLSRSGYHGHSPLTHWCNNISPVRFAVPVHSRGYYRNVT
ncbi:hypothetical protein GWI33_014647 [Rhynchophorus ferrugineus]|uniref:Uncharacterized protein n=1 Tax=Rhynchophorus ferrugineus TaxID=354439 RepID=A0A834M6Q9_RHYFE|nr:hypothetical protein GWI33_014647 [Rhynchophorus ferrugineus]